jgi:hypothetical protein
MQSIITLTEAKAKFSELINSYLQKGNICCDKKGQKGCGGHARGEIQA